MIATIKKAYQDLILESSNLMIRADSRNALGRYDEAAYCYSQAGVIRRQMGDLQYQTGDYNTAVQDWLSASACFVEATVPDIAKEHFQKAQDLDAEGHVSPERRDIAAALRERETEIGKLQRQLIRFDKAFDGQGHPKKKTDESALDVLLSYRRKLPGYWRLHFYIFCQALKHDDQTMAGEHLLWAARFQPRHATLTAAAGYWQMRLGKPDVAIQLGEGFLAEDDCGSGCVQLMLAQARLMSEPPNRDAALACFQKMVSDIQ